MNYLQWNNAIGKWFFNEEKSEKEIHLFITKQDVVKIGREQGVTGSEESIFVDFINSVRSGIPGSPKNGSILDLALFSYRKWKECPLNIDGISIDYPLYLGYLVLFVLPLVENENMDFRANAYYPPVRIFLDNYNLPTLPSQNENYNWNSLWMDLEEWSIIKNNTEIGYFELHPFSNSNWIYVGKPLSQCIFPPYAIKALPKFFDSAGLVPGEEFSYSDFSKLLLTYGKELLQLPDRVIKTFRDTNNELGQSIINIVRKNYQEWRGSTDQYDTDEETVKKGNTITQLRLCIEGDRARGFKTYYRLYSKLDYPEDLGFIYKGRELKCQQIGKGWSKPLFFSFEENIEFEDPLNKWKAKFPEKNIRLFIEGKNYHLSGWVEVPFLVASKMLLLVKTHLSASITEWGDCFAKGNFNKLSSTGLPEGYSLFEIYNPPIGHPDIPSLQFKSDNEKIITLSGGIKTGTRRWLKGLPPEVELENALGNEILYLLYDNSNERIYLKRKDTDQPVWLLPENIETNRAFFIKVEGARTTGEQLRNFIVDADGKEAKLKAEDLPARNKFGQIIQRENDTSFVFGCRLIVENERKFSLIQNLYSGEFLPEFVNGNINQSNAPDKNDHNELLLTFLTAKGTSNAQDYFEAFEAVYQSKFSPEEIEAHPIELTKLKSWSLNYLDYMGFLDYEYSLKKSVIIVNPPEFILIPGNAGRKVLLIGGRTPCLYENLKALAEQNNLQLSAEKQDASLAPFILPSAITLTGFNTSDGNEIIRRIKNVADKCSIYFDPYKYSQFRLSEFSGNINEYEQQLTPDERFDDSGWPARIFDAGKLRFVPAYKESIDKTCAMVEYRLTEYNLKYRLWKNGVSYDINNNWGKYMILNYYGKSVIFIDRKKNIIAIPASLPLPRLLAEAMTLFSGKTPGRMLLEIEGIKTWFNIFKNIPPFFAHNYFMKVGQKQKETTINL